MLRRRLRTLETEVLPAHKRTRYCVRGLLGRARRIQLQCKRHSFSGDMDGSDHDSQPAGRWRILLLLSAAQLGGISLWFTASGAAAQLQALWSLDTQQTGWLTVVVQLGFVGGTALAAILNLADGVLPLGGINTSRYATKRDQGHGGFGGMATLSSQGEMRRMPGDVFDHTKRGIPKLECPLRSQVAEVSFSTMPPAGLEPAAYGLGNRRSILLSYEGSELTCCNHKRYSLPRQPSTAPVCDPASRGKDSSAVFSARGARSMRSTHHEAGNQQL